MRDKLKPCPRCNGKAKLKELAPRGHYIVQCKNCRLKTGQFKLAEQAMQAWNMRIPQFFACTTTELERMRLITNTSSTDRHTDSFIYDLYTDDDRYIDMTDGDDCVGWLYPQGGRLRGKFTGAFKRYLSERSDREGSLYLFLKKRTW